MNKFLCWICLIITFSSFPYIGNYLFGPFYTLISAGLILTLAIIVIPKYFDNSIISPKSKEWFWVWIIYLLAVFSYAIILFLREGTLFDLRRFAGFLIKFLFVISASILIIKNSQFVFLFLKANYIIAVLSILLFFLLVLGFDLPFFSFTKIDGRDHYFYFIGASNTLYNFEGVRALRIAGFADEPGAFAMMLNYFLFINEITLKSKKYRIVFSVAGFLTFSLAFYLTFSFFLIYWAISKIINLNSLLIGASVVTIVILIVNNFFPIEAIKKIFELFFSRFEYNESSGTYKGDNRSESFNLQWQGFQDHFAFGIGDNLELKTDYELFNTSFLGFLANYGLYGAIFFLMPVYLIVSKYILKKEFILCLALLVSYLQRPGVEDMFSMLALSFIFFYSFKKQQFE